MSLRPRVAVIGAGIVGRCTAYALLERTRFAQGSRLDLDFLVAVGERDVSERASSSAALEQGDGDEPDFDDALGRRAHRRGVIG